MKVIFLDFDGVLNGYTKKTRTIFDVARKLHLIKFLYLIYDVFGIRFWKVFKLFCICKITGAKVVLSSSWKQAYYKPYKECGSRGKELQRKMKFWKIPVIGITKYCNGIRGKEIQLYLKNHPKIHNFIILDDESFDIKDYFPDNLILTSNGKVGTCYENSGLRLSHVIKAIQILNKKEV